MLDNSIFLYFLDRVMYIFSLIVKTLVLLEPGIFE
jgi:hypothetical protein